MKLITERQRAYLRHLADRHGFTLGLKQMPIYSKDASELITELEDGLDGPIEADGIEAMSELSDFGDR